MFARFAPGLRFPRHKHTGAERVLVLEGSYIDSDGRSMDRVRCFPGIWHEPRLSDRQRRAVHRRSGGERQRVRSVAAAAAGPRARPLK